MELSSFRPLYDSPGPWVSVYLDSSHHTNEAWVALKVRWKDLRRSLADQGVDDRTLQALDNELPVAPEAPERPRHPGNHGMAMFAAGGEVRYAEIMGAMPRSDTAEVSALPHLTPLLAQRGEQIPWLRVIVNRVGADIRDPASNTIEVQASKVFPLRRTHGGGWSQENFQRAAENTWKHNAKEVAAQVDKLAGELEAELLVVAGDVRARELFVEQLPERWRDRVVETGEGSRAAGADLSELDEVTRQAVAQAVARRVGAVIDRFMLRGGEFAASGLRAVVAAFDREQVQDLLLDPDRVAKTRLWMAADPSYLAITEAELRELPVQEVVEVVAEDALIRAAAITGIEVTLVQPEDVQLTEGAGVVLRYADQGTVHH